MSDDAERARGRRSKWKIIASGEAKLAPSLADLARVRDMWKAKREMKASAQAIEAAAKRADVVQKELKAAESRIQTLEKELKQFQGYGKQQKKLYATKEAFHEAKASSRRSSPRSAPPGRAEAEKKALKQTLKAQTAALKKATGVMHRAATGLKSKAGRAMGEGLATQAAQTVARFLAKVIPIVNIISTLWDLTDRRRPLQAPAGRRASSASGGEGEGGKAAPRHRGGARVRRRRGRRRRRGWRGGGTDAGGAATARRRRRR